jgi:hypothetical protein
MTLRERLRRTADWCDSTIAYHLPKRVKYWAVVHVGAHVTTQVDPNLIVPDVRLIQVLELAEGKPRS